jgi:PKD repeat protein
MVPAMMLLSCSKKDDTPPPPDPGVPAITFALGDGEQKVKISESITLTAFVENAERPAYSWKIDGKIVSTETSFTFVAEKLGEYFANFRVDAENGSAEKQLKISVLETLPPQITLGATAIAYIGIEKEFVAEADNADNAVYLWRLDGQIVSETSTYVFNQTALGNYPLTLKVTTADGQDFKTITVTVLPEQFPELFFDDGRYRTVTNAGDLRKMTVPIGKNLVLAPVICNISNATNFVWEVDGAQQSATGEYFNFTPSAEGTYLVSVTEQSTNATTKVQVTCTPPEGTYRRAGGTKAHATLAVDYGPAPGQFINYQKGSTKAKAMQDLQTWCTNGSASYFMIGAYGGYYMLGFDHSVTNVPGKADLQVSGNAFAGWCEPGIVWVMQDENGNGLADDTWYELKGSETGKPETKQRCAMTYYKPNAPNSNVLWTDNTGRAGSVDWLGAHQQQYYYPMFIAEDYYTLTGTCLSSTAGMSGSIEVSACYEWGYADNISSNDSRLSSQFWLEDAIHLDGSPANLQYIDFIKVHTATTGKGAAVGEISTEPVLPVDLNF